MAGWTVCSVTCSAELWISWMDVNVFIPGAVGGIDVLRKTCLTRSCCRISESS